MATAADGPINESPAELSRLSSDNGQFARLHDCRVLKIVRGSCPIWCGEKGRLSADAADWPARQATPAPTGLVTANHCTLQLCTVHWVHYMVQCIRYAQMHTRRGWFDLCCGVAASGRKCSLTLKCLYTLPELFCYGPLGFTSKSRLPCVFHFAHASENRCSITSVCVEITYSFLSRFKWMM